MQNVFIRNGGQIFGASKGQLNRKNKEITTNFMKTKGYQVRITNINDAYNKHSELNNFLWADVIIWHMPICGFNCHIN